MTYDTVKTFKDQGWQYSINCENKTVDVNWRNVKFSYVVFVFSQFRVLPRPRNGHTRPAADVRERATNGRIFVAVNQPSEAWNNEQSYR